MIKGITSNIATSRTIALLIPFTKLRTFVFQTGIAFCPAVITHFAELELNDFFCRK